MKGKLTQRQKRMVEEYLICGCKAKAATRAGFKSSYAQGAFKQPSVQKYLAERQAEIAEMESKRRGRWIVRKTPGCREYTICSECNFEVAAKASNGEMIKLDMREAKYCPNCGRPMEAGIDDEKRD